MGVSQARSPRVSAWSRAFIVTSAVLGATGVSAQDSTSRSMSFEECLQVIRRTAEQLGVAPVNIVETRDIRMVRFPSADGSVLVTCSRPDRKMVTTVTKK